MIYSSELFVCDLFAQLRLRLQDRLHFASRNAGGGALGGGGDVVEEGGSLVGRVWVLLVAL
jgi:hypothetical protein